MDRSTTGRALLASACAHSFDAPISRALMKANSRTTSAVSFRTRADDPFKDP
jgi:hypothetical protein